MLKLNLGNLGNLGGAKAGHQGRQSLLGLALDGPRVEGVWIRRSNGSVRIQNSATGTLELNLLTDDPALVGREIRNMLDRAEIREKHCAVCLPLEWALTAHTPVPDLPPEDVESFLSIEAERAFPFPSETLSLAISRCRAANGSEFATLIAIPKEHLATLQRVLRAAQLKPISFSLALPVMREPGDSSSAGGAALSIREHSVELQVTSGGGIAALRTLQGALEQDGPRRKPYVDVVARDLRITLGQLPAEVREAVHQLEVFGHSEELERFTEELGARARFMGLDVSLVRSYAPNETGVSMPMDAAPSPALTLAAKLLAGRLPALEFLPPKVSAWKQIAGKYSTRKLAWSGAAAGAALFLVAVAFAAQQWQLSRWRAKWEAMETRVTELDAMQQQIRRFRPWFDESFRCLNTLRKITESFPEDGSVFAKTLELRDPGVVSCSGTARDQKALIKMVDQLRAAEEFTSVQFDQIRGRQFTVNLRLAEGGVQ